MELYGPYYGVVNNAGITEDETFVALRGDQWDRVIQTNLGSFYNSYRQRPANVASQAKSAA